ncbi:Protein similar to glutamate synthase [NADPH] small chain, clustered with sulfite reductase [hydrothermal vent metagenome]|uniref:Protein similar to glutamate synthase [NADPH] small chain, clustered with sulfite reductase n=1 Tax=hydrothermal vent metagenome TaxID=652676 RepID=A0A3B0SK78_9ZZZZ
MSESIDIKHTVLTFEKGARPEDWDLEEKIFQGDTSHKCPTYVHKTPPCQGSCPSGHEIRGWLAIARGMDKPPVEGMSWQEYAFQRMVAANPFPATMGRVCPAPCEDGCNRNEVDDYVGINAVEQYVGDVANDSGFKLPDAGADTGKKIAVIGGGPAGLAAAYFLRLAGHGVTIFESASELGGMMRYGIPGYRTPREMLDTEIGRVVDMGCEVKLNTKVGDDIKITDLEAGYDAIFWAIGAQNGRGLPIDGWEGTDNCINGVDFLDAFNKGQLTDTVLNVVVIGGGDTSIDVASVARRIGHIEKKADKEHPEGTVVDFTAHDVAGSLGRQGIKATLTSLFPIDEMTAAEHEREDALREGVDIQGSVMPLEVIKGDDGRAVGLKVCDCTMDGMKPVPTEGTERVIDADLIISAIGQFGDFTGFEDLDNGRGFVDTDATYSVKGMEKHFAGGDIIRPHLLTTAIGHGRIAAETIGQFLAGDEPAKRPKVDVHHFNLLEELHQRGKDPEHYDHTPVRGTDDAEYAVHNYEDRSSAQIIPHSELFKGHFKYIGRAKRDEVHIEGDNVLGNFEERIVALSEEQAQLEGERCMSCGMCFECDNCIIFCPQDAVFKVKKAAATVGRYVDTDYTKCIGCHICADVCPTGYIKMGLGE